jgi:hypothetical protein
MLWAPLVPAWQPMPPACTFGTRVDTMGAVLPAWSRTPMISAPAAMALTAGACETGVTGVVTRCFAPMSLLGRAV